MASVPVTVSGASMRTRMPSSAAQSAGNPVSTVTGTGPPSPWAWAWAWAWAWPRWSRPVAASPASAGVLASTIRSDRRRRLGRIDMADLDS